MSVVSGQVAETLDVWIGNEGRYPVTSTRGPGSRPSTWTGGSAAPGERWGGDRVRRRRLHRHRKTVSVGAWSLDGVPLAAQHLTAATLPEMGGKGEPDGLLGSDVLSASEGWRVDFAAGALVLPGPRARPGPVVSVHRPAGRNAPALTEGRAALRCPRRSPGDG